MKTKSNTWRGARGATLKDKAESGNSFPARKASLEAWGIGRISRDSY
jgi:hypothetical protein